jgi:hypothetical protein
MALGEPVETRVEKSHAAYLSGVVTIPSMLDAAGVSYRRCLPDEKLCPGFAYILKVPSLNLPGMNHFILFDMRAHLEEYTVFDPVAGKPGKIAYVNNYNKDGEENYRLLESYTPYILFETRESSDLKLRYKRMQKSLDVVEADTNSIPVLLGAYVTFNKRQSTHDLEENEKHGIIVQTDSAHALVLTPNGVVDKVPLTQQNASVEFLCRNLKILQLSSEY